MDMKRWCDRKVVMKELKWLGSVPRGTGLVGGDGRVSCCGQEVDEIFRAVV